MARAKKGTVTEIKPRVNDTVVAAERVAEKLAEGVIQKEISYAFMTSQTPEDADNARQTLERDVLIEMSYQVLSGQAERTSAQNVALILARSYAAIHKSERDAGLVAAIRIEGLEHGLDRIDEVIARMKQLRLSFQTEIDDLKGNAATDEEYDAFRMSHE